MKIFKIFFNWKCHKDAMTSTFSNMAIGIIPLAAAMVMILYDKWQGWSFFWMNGEFFIYSVVFITSALYILVNLGVRNSNTTIIMAIIIMLCLVVSALLYGSLVYNNVVADDTQPVSRVLKQTSLSLLVVSLLIFYIMKYWDRYMIFTINKNEGREAIDDMKNKLTK